MIRLATDKTLQEARLYLQQVDPVLSMIIDTAPLPNIAPHKNYYRELVESIVSQQLSVKAASTILRRFIELFPGSNFPAPHQILEKSAKELRSVGLSRQKISYIQDLAMRVIDETVQFNHLDTLSNDKILAELVQVKGVGQWTVHMFLLSCMGRLDVLPTGDLGIKNGVQKLYGLKEKPNANEIEHIASQNNWHPYESVASWYIWYSLDNKPTI